MMEKYIKQIYEGAYHIAEFIDNPYYTIKGNTLIDNLVVDQIKNHCDQTEEKIKAILSTAAKVKKEYSKKFKELWEEQRNLEAQK